MIPLHVHKRGQLLHAGACERGLGDVLLRGAGLLQPLAAAMSFGGALFGQFKALAMLRHVHAQVLLKCLENRDIFIELGH